MGLLSVHALVPLHPRHCLPCHDILLCRLLLHHAPPLPGRDPHLCFHPQLHHAHAAVPHAELPIRSGARLSFLSPSRYLPLETSSHDIVALTACGVQINKTADRMYALFAVCNALSPSRLDDNIANIAKERYGDQFAKMSRG
jgi:hypothetical protein